MSDLFVIEEIEEGVGGVVVESEVLGIAKAEVLLIVTDQIDSEGVKLREGARSVTLQIEPRSAVVLDS